MLLIIIGLVLSGGGILLQANANMGASMEFLRHPNYIVMGSLLQIAAVFFVLVGMKQYFLKDIIDELKKLSAPKG